jgi:hypothetical protein
VQAQTGGGGLEPNLEGAEVPPRGPVHGCCRGEPLNCGDGGGGGEGGGGEGAGCARAEAENWCGGEKRPGFLRLARWAADLQASCC